MKTLKTIPALISLMIFFFLNSGFTSRSNFQNEPFTSARTVQVFYKVVVHLDGEPALCNDYQVELLDATGKLVAAPAIYHPGNSTYKFSEQANQPKGIRMARLSLVPYGPHAICPNGLSGTPDVKVIEFKDGEVYQFDLYPRIGTIKTVSE